MTIEEILDDMKTNRSKYIGTVNENIMEELTPNIVQYPTSASLITNMLNLLDSKGYWEQLAVDALAFELENIPAHGLPGQMIFINFSKQLENLNALNLIYLAEMFTDLSGWSYQMIFTIDSHYKETGFQWQYKHNKSGKIYSPFEFDELITEEFKEQFYKVLKRVSSTIKSKMTYNDWCDLLNLSGKDETDEMMYVNQVMDN